MSSGASKTSPEAAYTRGFDKSRLADVFFRTTKFNHCDQKLQYSDAGLFQGYHDNT